MRVILLICVMPSMFRKFLTFHETFINDSYIPQTQSKQFYAKSVFSLNGTWKALIGD